MNVYKINEYDLVINDYVNKFTRIIILNRNESLKPIYYTIPFGKEYVTDLVMIIMYRTSEEFIKQFVSYCKEYNVFQDTVKKIEEEIQEIKSSKRK